MPRDQRVGQPIPEYKLVVVVYLMLGGRRCRSVVSTPVTRALRTKSPDKNFGKTCTIDDESVLIEVRYTVGFIGEVCADVDREGGELTSTSARAEVEGKKFKISYEEMNLSPMRGGVVRVGRARPATPPFVSHIGVQRSIDIGNVLHRQRHAMYIRNSAVPREYILVNQDGGERRREGQWIPSCEYHRNDAGEVRANAALWYRPSVQGRTAGGVGLNVDNVQGKRHTARVGKRWVDVE
ncbi:hypothetical protein C8R44DRAFT_740498 [Mycena epipterygia]|nr:hypothetical protein C8R44DRAFT_740498 [Mycena epipterygia]